LVILIGAILFTAYLIWHLLKNSRPIRGVGVWLVSIYTLIILPWLLLAAYRTEPFFFPVWGNLTLATETLSRQAEPGDVVLVDGYQRPAWYHLMNYTRLEAPWFSLPEDSALWDASRLVSVLPNGGRVWFLVESERASSLESLINAIEALSFRCDGIRLAPSDSSPKYELKLCE